MKGTGLAFFLTAWMAGVLAVSCAKNDLMSGLDDHNAEEICFSMAPVMLEGHSVWLTPISRGRVSHSDSGLNTVGGVLSCPWFVNDWHSLRIMPLSDVEKKRSCIDRYN